MEISPKRVTNSCIKIEMKKMNRTVKDISVRQSSVSCVRKVARLRCKKHWRNFREGF